VANNLAFRVFVVDDEDIIATTLASILCLRGGFSATPFHEPTAALQAARRDKPDLLISDVAMPVLSGIELAIQVREHHPRCKVLLVSGHPDTSDWLAAARAKGHDFEILAKPVHPTVLLKRVEELQFSN
jgi:DNA-binding NtrC family response regulator